MHRSQNLSSYHEREAEEDIFILIHPRRREEVQEEKGSGRRGNEGEEGYYLHYTGPSELSFLRNCGVHSVHFM